CASRERCTTGWHRRGSTQTFQPVTHQRGVKPFSGDALLTDGQLFSSLLPEELRDLPVPPRGASEEEKLAYEAKFNQRARWRLPAMRARTSTGPRGGSAPSARGCYGAGRFPRRCVIPERRRSSRLRQST